MRRLGNVTAGAALLCLASTAFGADPSIEGLETQVVTLPEDLGEIADLGPLRFRGALTISTADPQFSGWSGIWVSPDGGELVGVDHGKWVRAALSYDGDGDLAGFTPFAAGSLHGPDGKELTGEEENNSEGLDFDGTDFLLSFETDSRVHRYRDIDGPASARMNIAANVIDAIVPPAGFSSITALADGSVLTIPEFSYPSGAARAADPERKNREHSPARGWMESKGGAGPIALEGAWPAAPVSVALLPNGDLLTVRLFLNIPAGVRVDEAWIGIVPGEQAGIGSTMVARHIAKLAAPMPSWRIEGSSAITGPQGETLVYLMTTSAPPVLYMFELAGGEGSRRDAAQSSP